MEIKVTIKIKDVEIKDLTLDEIKELRDVLAKIVDSEKGIIKEKEYVPFPIYVPEQPYGIEPYTHRYIYWQPIITTTDRQIPRQDLTISYCNS